MVDVSRTAGCSTDPELEALSRADALLRPGTGLKASNSSWRPSPGLEAVSRAGELLQDGGLQRGSGNGGRDPGRKAAAASSSLAAEAHT